MFVLLGFMFQAHSAFSYAALHVQALHYLHRCLIDVQLVSQRKLFWYDIELGSELHATTSTNAHLREATAGADAEEEGAVPTEPDRFMQLDSEAIQHLELVRNNDDGSERGTVRPSNGLPHFPG